MNASRKLRPVTIFTLGALALAFAACNRDRVPDRDYGELVPRMMRPLNHNANPAVADASVQGVTSADERRDAVAYLEKQNDGHDAEYMRAYEILTADPSAMVRAQAMRALASSRNPLVLPYLINGATGKSGLADPEAEVRRDAAEGMLKVFGEPAVDPVIAHMQSDPDDQVRIACTRALCNSRSPKAYRALIAALDDKNAAVVYWAHESLMSSTRQKFGFDGKRWLTWYQENYAAPGQPMTGARTQLPQ